MATWEDCRAKYRHWGTIYENLQKKFPDYVMDQKDQKIFQSCKILMKNMIALVNLLEATPDFYNVRKNVSRTTLGIGLFEDELVTGCTIDWLNKQQKYQISFTEVNFIVNLEQVVATIQEHINYQRETNTFDFEGLKNWSWERCRHRFLLECTGYAKASHEDRIPGEKMIALIDLLEADPQLTNTRKRIGHDWLFLRLVNSTKNVGMSIEWINEIKKFRIKLGRQDNNTIFETNLDNAIPTIKRNIQHFQENEQEQDNNPE